MTNFLRTSMALALACFVQGAYADMLRFDLRATFLPGPWITESIFGVDLSEGAVAPYEFTGSFVLDTANPVGFVPAAKNKRGAQV